MSRRRTWLVAALVVVLGSMGLYAWRSEASRSEPPDSGNRRTTRVVRGTLTRTTIATGVIRPVIGAEINVGSRISGTVKRLPVAVGDRVEAGQLLAEIDAAALEAAVDQARADLALAESREALAASSLDRSRRLKSMDVVSSEALETSVRDAAVARAQVDASAARLRSAEIALGYAQITAPIPGVIADVTTREGETVAAGFSAPTFVTIVDLDRLEVLAYVDETDVGRLFVGQEAFFTVDTYPGTEFTATVTAIQPKAELQGSVVNYVARLDFVPRDGCTLRPEMTAHLRLQLGAREQALSVPREAIRHRDGREHVLVERHGEWVEQRVTTGWRTSNAVEILSGLEEGETLELNSQQEARR